MRLEPDHPTDLTMIAFPFWLWLVFEGIAEASQSSVESISYIVDNLRDAYPSSALIDIWRVLLCPPVVLYREILLERRKGFLFGDGITWVPDAARLNMLCCQLASYLKLFVTILSIGLHQNFLTPNSGMKYNRDQAERCVNAVMQLDRYCTNAISKAIIEVVPEAISSSTIKHIPRYLRDMSKRVTIYRHKLPDGRVHLRVGAICMNSSMRFWKTTNSGSRLIAVAILRA